jgi:SPOR domain
MEIKVGSLQFAVGSRQLAVGSRQYSGCGNRARPAYCLLNTAYFSTTTYFSKCLLLTAYLLTASIQTNAQRNKGPKPHHEDLMEHRLSFPEVIDSVITKVDEPKVVEILPAKNSVSTKVNEVLDSIARFNKTRMFVDGFTIQLYAGLKKDEAMNAKKRMTDGGIRDLSVDLRYEQPKWRVKTGSYYTRLEAQRDLHRVKRIFPNAILIPEKVALRW